MQLIKNVEWKTMLIFIMVSAIFFYYPYYTTLVLSLCLAAVIPLIKNERIYILLEYYFFCCFIFVSTITVGTKPIFGNMTGNDKFVYYEYMVENHSKNIIDWVLSYRGFDFVSYFSFKLASDIFGAGDIAFIVIFVIYVCALYWGYRIIAGKYAPLAITLFLSQYIFSSFYSNTIRQGISFSFIILALAHAGNKRRYLYTVLAGLSHYSSLIYAPFLILIKKIKNVSFKTSLFLYASSYFCGSYILPLILSKLSSLGSFFLVRVNSYGGDNFGVDYKSRVLMSIFFIFVVETTNLCIRSEEKNRGFTPIIRNIFVVFVCCFFFTSSFEEISNRYSFAIVPLGLLFFSMSMNLIKNSKAKVILLYVILIFSWAFNLYIVYHRGITKNQ